MRRSHNALKPLNLVSCPKCKEKKLPHSLCHNCGEYKGRQVIDVLAKLTKKERKTKEAELKTSLNMEELSRK